MASDEVEIKVTPDGPAWHIDVAGKRLLTLRTKDAAVAEAYVQAVSSRPSRVLIYDADGSVEAQAAFPPDGADRAEVPS